MRVSHCFKFHFLPFSSSQALWLQASAVTLISRVDESLLFLSAHYSAAVPLIDQVRGQRHCQDAGSACGDGQKRCFL